VAVFEPGFIHHVGRHGHVLFFATGVGKTQVNELDAVVLDHFQNVSNRHNSLHEDV